MAFFSVVLTPRTGVTLDLSGYTHQINDRLKLVNQYAADPQLLYKVDDTLRVLMEAWFPKVRHAVSTLQVYKDGALYGSINDYAGWTRVSAASDPGEPTFLIME